MNTLLVAATSAFLVLAPFPGSAGLRISMLLAGALLLVLRPRELRLAFSELPRGVAAAYAAWAALAIASLAWSVQPAYTRAELKAEILYGAIAFLVFHCAASLDASRWRAWWHAALAGTALMALWFVLQEVLPISLPRHTMIEQRGPWSTHLVLVMPLVFAASWPRPWGGGRGALFQAIAFGLLLLAAWQTGSR